MTRCTWSTILIDREQENDDAKRIDVFTYTMGSARKTVLRQQCIVHPNVEKEILPYSQQHQIGVIVYSPMASGLLTGKMTRARIANLPEDDWRKRGTEFQEPRLSLNLELANLLAEIGKAHKVTAGVVAIAWTLHNPAVTAAIVGARHPSQVEETIAAAEFRLSEREYEQIGQFVAQHP